MVEPVGEEQRKLKLRSSDGHVFEVPEDVAFRSGTVKTMLTDVEASAASQVIPLENVRSDVLAKVIEWNKYHAKADKEKKEKGSDLDDDDDDDEEYDYELDSDRPKEQDDEVKKWDKEFVNVEQHVLFELMLAANYLDVKDLLDFLIQAVADMIIACKDPAEVRSKFNIPDDLTPEEVEDIKRKNTWAFE